ncbi:MAG: hypothetical protein NVSMB2_01690 [Chloroflexota bacterium]
MLMSEVAVAVRRRWQVWLWPLTLVMLWSWVARIQFELQEGGPFRRVGIDFSMYLAQAQMLHDGHAATIYDLASLDTYLERLRVFTIDPSQPLSVGPVPYAPVFTWVMSAFVFASPPVAFAIWTALNVLAIAYLGWRIAQVVPGLSTLLATVALVGWFPFAVGLAAGQPTAILGCAVAQWYLASRRGQNWQAGLWLSLLLIKPQYGILIAPLLLWKWRWGTVLGACMGCALILVVSLAVVGPGSLMSYTSAVADVAPWDGAALASPGQMINWRAMVLNLRPSIGPISGFMLTGFAGVLTVAAVAVAWRGSWSAASWTFAPRVAVLGLGTVLANYHSHSHGLALFALPLAACLAEQRVRPITRAALLILAFVPTLYVITLKSWVWSELLWHQPPDVLIWSPLLQLLLAACLVLLVRDVIWPIHPAAVTDQGQSSDDVAAAPEPRVALASGYRA